MPAKPYPGTNSQIEKIAAGLRAKAGAQDEGASSASLVRRLVGLTGGGIEVVEDPSDQEFDGGSLVIRGKRDYTIFLSPYTTPLRDNFTIAHELGHYVLHFFLAGGQVGTPAWFARYGTSPIEWQANRFAAALLMPENEFRAAYQACDGDLSLLSGQFDVSLPAVEVRTKSLGLLVE